MKYEMSKHKALLAGLGGCAKRKQSAGPQLAWGARACSRFKDRFWPNIGL